MPISAPALTDIRWQAGFAASPGAPGQEQPVGTLITAIRRAVHPLAATIQVGVMPPTRSTGRIQLGRALELGRELDPRDPKRSHCVLARLELASHLAMCEYGG